jgi:hypothetical protein
MTETLLSFVIGIPVLLRRWVSSRSNGGPTIRSSSSFLPSERQNSRRIGFRGPSRGPYRKVFKESLERV